MRRPGVEPGSTGLFAIFSAKNEYAKGSFAWKPVILPLNYQRYLILLRDYVLNLTKIKKSQEYSKCPRQDLNLRPTD